MCPKDLALQFKASLERECCTSDVADYGFDLKYNHDIAIAKVEKFIQGKWFGFKIIIQADGVTEDALTIGA